jgi:TolA-binding protein
LSQGRIHAIRGELPEARQKFEAVVTEYEDSPSADFALLGMGEVEATRGEADRSIESYARLVKRMRDNEKAKRHEIDVDVISKSLLSRFAERRDAGDIEAALRFAEQAEQLYKVDDLPPEVAIAIAQAHKRLAEEKIEAMGLDPAVLDPTLDPATLREVQAHYLAAGHYFKEHRDRVVITDLDSYEQSLWNAADCLDRAGDQESAVALFKEHVQAFASTGRAAEGKYRLGRAYQARGEVEASAKLFRELVDARDLPADQGGSGVSGDLSYVPLAQSLLADTDPSNDTEAEANLLAASSGAPWL